MSRFRVTVFQGEEQIDRFVFEKNVVTIGRSSDADVRIPSKTVSRQQAELLRTSQGFALFAHKSTNVTKVRGEEVPAEGSIPLVPGDPIRIADTFDLTLEVLDDDGNPSTADEAPTPVVGTRIEQPDPPPEPARPTVPLKKVEAAPPSKPVTVPSSEQQRAPKQPVSERVKPPTGARPKRPVGDRPKKAVSERVKAPVSERVKKQPGERVKKPAAVPPPAGGGSILGATHGAPVPIPPPVEVQVIASARERQGPAGARLLCRLNGTERAFEVHDDFYVGGGDDNDLCLNGGYAPRRAALIVRVEGRYRVYNTSPLAETVLVNGKGIQGHADLVAGDELSVYGVKLTFEAS